MKKYFYKTLSVLLFSALIACRIDDSVPPEFKNQAENLQFGQMPQSAPYSGQRGGAPFQSPLQAPINATPDYYYAQPVYGTQAPNGGSRAYNNPYAFDPPAQYPYYEADQYYVPPKYYGVPTGPRPNGSSY